MPSYDGTRFTPPAPLARVTLRSSDQKTAVKDVPMLLDTGADVSLVPRAATEKLILPEGPVGFYQLLSFDGRATSVPAFHLEMIFCGRVFQGRYLLSDEDCGIVGRNILNLLPILYDGPRLTWELLKAAERR